MHALFLRARHARLQSMGSLLQHHSRLSRLFIPGIEMDQTADMKVRERGL